MKCKVVRPIGVHTSLFRKLYTAEYKHDFETERSVAEIKSISNEPNKLILTIDGVSDVTWFRQKQNEFLQKIGIKANQNQVKY